MAEKIEVALFIIKKAFRGPFLKREIPSSGYGFPRMASIGRGPSSFWQIVGTPSIENMGPLPFDRQSERPR